MNLISILFSRVSQIRFDLSVCLLLNLLDAGQLLFGAVTRILSPMSRLKYFTLILVDKQPVIDNDFLNGRCWTQLLSTKLIDLKTFQFEIAIKNQSEQWLYSVLQTFRSSQWLNEKQCRVEYDHQQGALITVPYFASKVFDNRQPYRFELIQHLRILHSNITQMNLDLNEERQLQEVLPAQSHFAHVTRLSLDGCLTNDECFRIRQHLNCQTIRHVVILSTLDITENSLN